MRFTWDENKNRANLAKHGIAFEDATQAFFDPAALFELNRIAEGEQRWGAIGSIGSLALLAVFHTWTQENGEEIIRIISARKATAHERKKYYAQFGS